MSSSDRLVELVGAYHEGRYSHGAAERVARWLELFPQDSQQQVADELAHVLHTSYLSCTESTTIARRWLTNPADSSCGLLQDWSDSTFLQVQSGGGSQAAVLHILRREAKKLGLADPVAGAGHRVHVYVDDVSVQGMRLLNDLTPWIRDAAPANVELLVLLQRRLASQQTYLAQQLKARAQGFGKCLRVTWSSSLDFGQFDCYQPRVLPNDSRLHEYLAQTGIKAKLRSGQGPGRHFSSEPSRSHLEQALLLAGIDLLSVNHQLAAKKHMRPLGNTVWPGLGIGVPIVTWRNCPNSAPIALWAEGTVPPLFPRDAN